MVVAVLILVILNRTTFGYELRATGLNKNAAKYAGMRDKFNIVLTMESLPMTAIMTGIATPAGLTGLVTRSKTNILQASARN